MKRALYERIGVPEYWFADLDADRIEIHRLVDGAYGPPILATMDDQVTPPHLPGLSIDVADALRPIKP